MATAKVAHIGSHSAKLESEAHGLHAGDYSFVM
jgi:hypothetical protein